MTSRRHSSCSTARGIVCSAIELDASGLIVLTFPFNSGLMYIYRPRVSVCDPSYPITRPLRRTSGNSLYIVMDGTLDIDLDCPVCFIAKGGI